MAEEITGVVLNGALRSIELPHAPPSLSSGFVSMDPLSYLPPYSLSMGVPVNASVSAANVHLDASSLPITVALATSLGARGDLVSVLPGSTARVYSPGNVALTSTVVLQVVTIDALQSTWTFADRVRFRAHFFGSTNAGGVRVGRTAVDVRGDRIKSIVLSDTALRIAVMPLDGSPLTVTRFEAGRRPPPAFGAALEDLTADVREMPVTGETLVEAIAPSANEFVAAALEIERTELVETVLRKLGDIAHYIELALEGSGRTGPEVNQPTFVAGHEGFLRALAAATTSTTRPLVDGGSASNYALFPLVDDVEYVNVHGNAIAITCESLDLLPALSSNFVLQHVYDMANMTVPYVQFEYIEGAGTSISRTTPEITLDGVVRIVPDAPITVREPLGAGNAFVVERVLTANTEHALQIAYPGTFGLEITSSRPHEDVVATRGRPGLVQPPVVGRVVGAAMHEARVHIFHDDVISGNLELKWAHQPSAPVATLQLPLPAANTCVTALDSAAYATVRRRSVRISEHAERDVSIPIETRTCAFWFFADADGRMDTWRAPYAGGNVVVADGWFAASLDAANGQLVVESLFGAGTVAFDVQRDAWTFACVRADAQRIVVAGANSYQEKALNCPLNASTIAHIKAPRGVHVRGFRGWNITLSDEVVRTLADNSIGPMYAYDCADVQLQWQAAVPASVGLETRLLLGGDASGDFEVAHNGIVWYEPRVAAPTLTSLNFFDGLTTAFFSSSVALAYGVGQGLSVVEVDGAKVTFVGNVAAVPPGSFYGVNSRLPVLNTVPP